MASSHSNGYLWRSGEHFFQFNCRQTTNLHWIALIILHDKHHLLWSNFTRINDCDGFNLANTDFSLLDICSESKYNWTPVFEPDLQSLYTRNNSHSELSPQYPFFTLSSQLGKERRSSLLVQTTRNFWFDNCSYCLSSSRKSRNEKNFHSKWIWIIWLKISKSSYYLGKYRTQKNWIDTILLQLSYRWWSNIYRHSSNWFGTLWILF